MFVGILKPSLQFGPHWIPISPICPIGDIDIPEPDSLIPEVDGGYYDDWGFYILPNGGFIDPYGNKFNADGFDERGGYYSNAGIYIRPKPQTP